MVHFKILLNKDFFLVQFSLVFKGRFSHPLTFLGAGAKKNPHFHQIPKNAEVSWTTVDIQHHAWNVTAQEDGKPTWGSWRDLNGSGSRGTFPVMNPYPESRAGHFSQRIKFFIAVAEGRKRISSGALQLMKVAQREIKQIAWNRGAAFPLSTWISNSD